MINANCIFIIAECLRMYNWIGPCLFCHWGVVADAIQSSVYTVWFKWIVFKVNNQIKIQNSWVHIKLFYGALESFQKYICGQLINSIQEKISLDIWFLILIWDNLLQIKKKMNEETDFWTISIRSLYPGCVTLEYSAFISHSFSIYCHLFIVGCTGQNWACQQQHTLHQIVLLVAKKANKTLIW